MKNLQMSNLISWNPIALPDMQISKESNIQFPSVLDRMTLKIFQ